VRGRGGLPAVPARLELADLVKQRDEVERQHETAVAELEKCDTERAIGKRRECGRLYDARAELQRRIDALIAAERAR
jgi:hypothetical protein